MLGVASHLRDKVIVGVAQVLVQVTFFVVPLGQLLDDALQVLDAISTSLHGVVTQVLGLCAWVVVAAFAAKPVALALVELGNGHFVQRQALLFFGLQVGEVAVAPFDGPLVVVVDTGEDALLRDVVLWLCHIVETGVVHDRSRVTVLLNPCFVAKAVNGCGIAGTHIVAQAQCVANLMTGDEADELSHEFVVELRMAGTRVNGAALNLIPAVQQFHDIMVPAHVALDNLARTRVADVRAIGVADVAGQIADDRETGILKTHCRVVGPLLGADGVLEASLLEGHVPVIDACHEVRYPLLRRSRVNVVHNLLDGLYQFTTTVGIDVLWHQTVAGDDVAAVHTLLIVTILIEPLGEVAYALVERAILHLVLRQQHKRGVQLDGQ